MDDSYQNYDFIGNWIQSFSSVYWQPEKSFFVIYIKEITLTGISVIVKALYSFVLWSSLVWTHKILSIHHRSSTDRQKTKKIYTHTQLKTPS